MSNRIRELREGRKMSQVRLSIELGVSQETISAYESGKHFPSYAALVKLSDLFGVSIDYLMGRSNSETPTDPGLTSDERTLLENYRTLDTLGRINAAAYLQGLAER